MNPYLKRLSVVTILACILTIIAILNRTAGIIFAALLLAVIVASVAAKNHFTKHYGVFTQPNIDRATAYSKARTYLHFGLEAEDWDKNNANTENIFMEANAIASDAGRRLCRVDTPADDIESFDLIIQACVYLNAYFFEVVQMKDLHTSNSDRCFVKIYELFVAIDDCYNATMGFGQFIGYEEENLRATAGVCRQNLHQLLAQELAILHK